MSARTSHLPRGRVSNYRIKLTVDPYLDGQLEDEGPRTGERRLALVLAACVFGSALLIGGPESLIDRGHRGIIITCLLGVCAVLFRDPLSESLPDAFSRSGALPPAVIGWIGWVALGLSGLAEITYWFPK
jgi:hypothetical protein